MSAADQEQIDNNLADGDGEGDDEYDGAEGEEDEMDQDEEFKNNHDLIGVEGIIAAQKNEIDGKKVTIQTSFSFWLGE